MSFDNELSFAHKPHLALDTWIASIPASQHLYLLLSGTCADNPIAAYEQWDGSKHFHPLYTQDDYNRWTQVMPYLVAIAKDSPFLEWIKTTEAKDWGWLCTSTADVKSVAAHFEGLMQAFTPDGTKVFFRYWDGQFFSTILRTLQEDTHFMLPVVSQFWINHSAFYLHENRFRRPRESPWWEIPEKVMAALESADPQPALDNLLKYLKEEQARLYFSVPEPVLKAKIRQFHQRWPLLSQQMPGLNLTQALCLSLDDDRFV
ncbi:DUF4123 domain-containing protein [Pokkaliibacter sp. CJK22405]|uniref:DUF4123 domain-containing protein n=1 Tax=Pokkaliibacter sp. CJK22405 TaxID=3384615 RepID=UPI003984D58B